LYLRQAFEERQTVEESIATYRSPVADIYNQISPCYDSAYKEKRFFAEDKLIRKELLKENATGIVDLGCGTGLGYALLDEPFAYCGVDISEGMIVHAEASYPRAAWHIADACDTGLETGAYGLIVSLYGCISYVPDIRALFHEVKRLMRPFGAYFLVGYNVKKYDSRNSLMVGHSCHLWHDHEESEIRAAAQENGLTAEIRGLSRYVDKLPSWVPQPFFNALIRAEWAMQVEGGYYYVVRGNGKA